MRFFRVCAVLASLTQCAVHSAMGASSEAVENADSEQFQNYILQVQHPKSCSDAPMLLFDSGSGGFFQKLLLLRDAFSVALSTQRVMVDMHKEAYINPRICGADKENFECYFEPLTSCKVSEKELTSLRRKAVRMQKVVPAGLNSRVVALTPSSHRSSEFRTTFASRLHLQVASRGNFWFAKEIMRYIMRPNMRVQKMLQETKRKLNWVDNAPRVGVHIRHGDTVHLQFPVWAYADAAKRLSTAYGLSELYFTSDDKRVYEWFPALVNKHFKRIISMPEDAFPRTWTGYSDTPTSAQFPTKINRSQDLGNHDEGLELVIDALLLADSTWLVGTSSSNVVLRAYELGATLRSPAPMFHDLRNQGWMTNFWVDDIVQFGATATVCLPRGVTTETPWELRFHARSPENIIFPRKLLPTDVSDDDFEEFTRRLNLNSKSKKRKTFTPSEQTWQVADSLELADTTSQKSAPCSSLPSNDNEMLSRSRLAKGSLRPRKVDPFPVQSPMVLSQQSPLKARPQGKARRKSHQFKITSSMG